MDWVLNNLDNVIIPIIILILYGLGSAAQKKEKAGKKPQGGPAQQVDPDESRRVREIQEEIRRKIAERTGRVPPPPRQRSAPVLESPGQKLMPAHRQKIPEPARRPTPPPITQPTFRGDTYQREIEAKLRKVKELEAQVKKLPTKSVWGEQKRAKVPKGQLRTQLFMDLANPLGQRKAILVSEILGSPLGIKGPSHWKSNV